MPRILPANPSIERLKKEAQTLYKHCAVGNADAIHRVKQNLTTFRFQVDSEIATRLQLCHALDVIAREYGFTHWTALSTHAMAERSNHKALNEAMTDPRMQDLAFRCDLARSKGLPEIGTQKISEYGMRYTVTDYAPALSPRGGQRVRKGGPANHIDDLMPVIAFPEMSDRLYEFYLETDCATARPLVFIDTLPDTPHGVGLTGVHQVLVSASLPDLYFLFDASKIHETILAHELGHIWVEMVDRVEDNRHPKEQADLPKITQFYQIQSFVMDLRVNDLLERRGFDMSIIANHQMEAITNIGNQAVAGNRPGNARILGGVISFLAGALLEIDRFPAKSKASMRTSLELIERHMPEVFEPAKALVQSVLRNGYDTCEAVKRVVDECCVISFAATGDSFDPETDLIDMPHEEPEWDKHPDFLPGLPRSNKREILRRAAQHGVTGSAKYDVVISGRQHITATLTAPILPEPVTFGMSLDRPPQLNPMPVSPMFTLYPAGAHAPAANSPNSGFPPGVGFQTPAPYQGVTEHVREMLGLQGKSREPWHTALGLNMQGPNTHWRQVIP